MSFPRLFEQPLSLWSAFQDEDMLNRFWRLPRFNDENGKTAFMPPCDITEKDGGYALHLDLPGLDKKDISVSLKNGILSIEAESSTDDKTEEDGKVIFRERRYGKYMRCFNLGENVRDSEVKANFKDGVLSLYVPKQEFVEEDTRKIAIE